MVLRDGLLDAFVKNLRISDTFGSLPYRWNAKKRQLELKSATTIRNYRIRLGLGSIYVVLLLVQIVQTWGKSDRMVSTHSILFTTSYILNIANVYLNAEQPKSVVELFNRMIEFEDRRYPKDTKTASVKEQGRGIALAALQWSASTGISMPILYHLDVLKNPCFPMYFGYWLSEQCGSELGKPLTISSSLGGFAIKVCISLLSYVNWSFLFACHTFMVCFAIILQGHWFRSYISKYGSEMMKFNNVTKATEKKVLEFRELQVMSIQYRSIYSRYYLNFTSIAIIILAVLCLFNSISTAAYGNGSGSTPLGMSILYFWCAIACALVILIDFGILADVHANSALVQGELKSRLELKGNKWCRRFLKSCPVIRIYVGGTNFFEKETPLNLWNFVVDQTVSLLLLD